MEWSIGAGNGLQSFLPFSLMAISGKLRNRDEEVRERWKISYLPKGKNFRVYDN